jgi:hypothetical protein
MIQYMKYIIITVFAFVVMGCNGKREEGDKMSFIKDQFMTIENANREFAILYRSRDINMMEMTNDAEIEGYGLSGDFVLKRGRVTITTIDGKRFVFPDEIDRIRNREVPKILYLQ